MMMELSRTSQSCRKSSIHLYLLAECYHPHRRLRSVNELDPLLLCTNLSDLLSRLPSRHLRTRRAIPQPQPARQLMIAQVYRSGRQPSHPRPSLRSEELPRVSTKTDLTRPRPPSLHHHLILIRFRSSIPPFSMDYPRSEPVSRLPTRPWISRHRLRILNSRH